MTSLTYGELELIVDLFTFPHGGNWNKQGGHVTLMWLAALFEWPGSAFDVATQYFEEILFEEILFSTVSRLMLTDNT